jgi:predicted nucleic acid-binding protein
VRSRQPIHARFVGLEDELQLPDRSGEPRAAVLDPGVLMSLSWLDSLPAREVGTTAVTAAELLYGVARMPAGRRKTELAVAVGGLLGNDFRDRVLPFDERCASRYADIAAICRTAEAALATRNTDDFSGTGIELINPWKLDRPEPA